VARVARPRKAQKHRPHRPAELGPRVYLRGRWYWVDCRAFGGARQPIRNPKHPNWPDAGDRTMDRETAARWAWRYLDHYRVDAKRRHLGLRGPSKPLGVEVERYLAFRDRTASIKTALTCNTTFRVHVVPFFGESTPLDTIDRDELQRFANALFTRGYAHKTVEGHLGLARSFFRWQSDGANDPTKGVKLPNAGERDVEPWSDIDIAKLRKAADTLDAEGPKGFLPRALRSYRLALELALATGCRLAELGALEWSAIDADERTIRVRHQLPPDGYGHVLQPLKGRRNRTALILPSWWDFHDDQASGRILLADGIETCAIYTLSQHFARIIERAGIKRAGQNVHTFRHTYSRLALEMGARLEELQKFLGHASIRTTEESYGWLTEQAAATLARSRIYGEQLRLVKPKTKEGRRAAR
jgi:integrase